MSYTDECYIHVPARALTDPVVAHKLGYSMRVIANHERARGHHAAGRFIDDLCDALTDYALELEGAHDRVVDAVMRDLPDHPPCDEGGGS